jgi:F-type H+-transporting ATPase subunit epsilon
MSIQVDLITPERQVFSDNVDFIAAPTVDGQIGILSNHAPLLAQLGLGELRLKKGGFTSHVAITGGFIEVQKGSRVSIFAETAEMAEEIDVERARLALERAKTTLQTQGQVDKIDFAAAEAALARAILRMKIVENRRKAPAKTFHGEN